MKQPGQVWFPDSAYKTAQAIQDFSHGENLPLMIFANWRGFSGGQMDMFREVLKFGSYIVDNLRTYRQPIFVYLPPFAELRGGSWVVVDPTINQDYMEMYADPNARGGVLEPSGTIQIKYREAERVDTMKRLDANLAADSKRRAELMPVYEQVATTFADLHDTPGRMKAKGVISEIVGWNVSREFFYWRLRRRLHEERIAKAIQAADPVHNLTSSRALLTKLQEKGGLSVRIESELMDSPANLSPGGKAAVENKAAVMWLEETEDWIAEQIIDMKTKSAVEQMKTAILKDPSLAALALAEAVKEMSAEQRSRFQRQTRQYGL